MNAGGDTDSEIDCSSLLVIRTWKLFIVLKLLRLSFD